MQKHAARHVFTSESVSEGHPDKVADQISDAVLDACLAKDARAHVACETMCGPNLVVNMGEIACKGFEDINTQSIARGVVKDIGYDQRGEDFSCDTFNYLSALHAQSPDIAQGVNRKKAEKQGAGDQGMMFGYATRETKSFMPTALVYSHELLRHFAALRKSGEIPFLRPDSKSQLSVVYEDGRPVAIDTVVLSHQTTEKGANRKSYALLEEVTREFLAKNTKLLTPKTRFFVNPTGKFVVGGPAGDSGLTGRKIIVDTYGGMAAHGGGAFSGKDPSKVDRSAAYYARYAAKNIVAAGYADRCQIQVAYAIGVDKPVSVCVKTFGTSHNVTNEQLKLILSGKVFDFRPYALIADLGLTKPKGWCYRDTASYGHFGRAAFPWEKTDKVAAIKDILG